MFFGILFGYPWITFDKVTKPVKPCFMEAILIRGQWNWVENNTAYSYQKDGPSSQASPLFTVPSLDLVPAMKGGCLQVVLMVRGSPLINSMQAALHKDSISLVELALLCLNFQSHWLKAKSDSWFQDLITKSLSDTCSPYNWVTYPSWFNILLSPLAVTVQLRLSQHYGYILMMMKKYLPLLWL